jgi:WD40 repeat protein
MGGAFVGVGNDVSCIYWNPAGLALLRKNAFGYISGIADRKGTHTIRTLVQDNYYFYMLPTFTLAKVYNIKNIPEGVVSYVYASDIYKYQNLPSGVICSPEIIVSKKDNLTIFHYLQDYTIQHQLAVGLKLSENFYTGINLKYCSTKRDFVGQVPVYDPSTLEQVGGVYFSESIKDFYPDVDIGFLLKTEYTSFGLVVQHINQPIISLHDRMLIKATATAGGAGGGGEGGGGAGQIIAKWFIDKKDIKINRNVRAGLAISPDDKTIFSIDIYDISGKTKDTEEDLSQDLSVGIERQFTENFTLRLGLWHINSACREYRGLTGGINYNFKLFNSIVDVGYAYVNRYLHPKDKEFHSLGISIKF